MIRVPFKMVVGPLPKETIEKRKDGMRYLAMIVVESETGHEMVCDIDGAPTYEGAKSKGEGLSVHFKPGHPSYDDAIRYLDEHGWPEK